MKLSTNSAVTRLLHEGITDIDSLIDFDKDSIESLPRACSRAIAAVEADADNDIEAEAAVPAGNLSTASVHRLIVAANAARYYRDIGRTRTVAIMHYNNILAGFKLDFDAYCTLKKQDAPDVPLVYDKDKDKKVIKWAPLFLDAMSRTFGAKGPLRYVLRENAAVPAEAEDPLSENCHYSATAGSMLEELIRRLPHSGPTFRDDNKTVFMAISTAVAGTSVETTIKSYSRQKDGRGAYFALITNHAGDVKYRSIYKLRMNLLTNVKWNGRSYALETLVSNHRQAVDDLIECQTKIHTQVPDEPQRVEYLLDAITCQDSALQAAIGNIRANTNDMRSQFEVAASHLIEVDPYKRVARGNQGGGGAKVSDARFSAGRGKTGVDLRWHPLKEFMKLSNEQRDELVTWQKSAEGKKTMAGDKKKRGAQDNKSSSNNDNWKKKFKKSLKTPEGLAHVMSVMREEESANAALTATMAPVLSQSPAAAQQSTATQPAATAGVAASVDAHFQNLATKVKLQSILKSPKKSTN